MKNLKLVLLGNALLLTIALLAVMVSGCSQNSSGPNADLTKASTKVIAITQIIEHKALDKEREGFLATLKEEGYIEGDNLKVHYLNAQGNMSIAIQIAQKFVSIQPDLMVGISTPSSQALLSALGQNKTPLLFSAVADPIAAKLLDVSGQPTDRVTGVTDYLTPKSQLEMLKKLMPQLTRLGFIYNPGEVNSGVALEQMKNISQNYGITLIPSPANTTAEVPAAATALLGKVEAIYLPTDNTAVASIDSILQVGIKHKIPVFAADIGSVEKGAIAMVGYDRIKLGNILGKMAVRILKGESTKNIPMAKDHPLSLAVNREAAAKMNFKLPEHLPEDTHFITVTK